MVKKYDYIKLGKWLYDGARGYSPIDWAVINIEDTRSLLLCRHALVKCGDRNTPHLVAWFNSNFINCFTPQEKQRIDGDIFLLSAKEIRTYLPEPFQRECKIYNPILNEFVPAHYWLRTEEIQPFNDYVNSTGDIKEGEFYTLGDEKGARPALWLKH